MGNNKKLIIKIKREGEGRKQTGRINLIYLHSDTNKTTSLEMGKKIIKVKITTHITRSLQWNSEEH